MKKIILLMVMPIVILLSCCALYLAPMSPALTPEPPASSPIFTPALSTTQSPLRVIVDAKKGWQKTNATIESNRPFEIQYLSGKWTHFKGKVPLSGPEGGQYTCFGPSCCEPLPGVASGALIGRVGGETFSISLGGPFAIKTTGTLFVRINDCDTGLSDNDGTITILVIP